MSKTAETDDRGRIVIPHEIREKHGSRYRVVELDDRIELIPLPDDPVAGLRAAVGDTFDGMSIGEIKQEARDAARESALTSRTTADSGTAGGTQAAREPTSETETEHETE